MATFEIWIEGYLATGMEGTPNRASRIAVIDAETFADACVNFSKTEKAKGYGRFDKERLSFWGCRLFDNEQDARKSFG